MNLEIIYKTKNMPDIKLRSQDMEFPNPLTDRKRQACYRIEASYPLSP